MSKDDKQLPIPSAEHKGGHCPVPDYSTRFPKGVSGNPNGRPRGRKGLRKSLEAILNQKIKTRVGDKVRSMSKGEAILSMMVNSALKGDFNTGLKALALAGRLEADAAKESQRRKQRTDQLSNEEIIKLVIERRIATTELFILMPEEQLQEVITEMESKLDLPEPERTKFR